MSVQCCFKPGIEGESLGVVDQRHVTGLAVGIVTHEDRQLAAGPQGGLAVADESAVADKKMAECRRAGQVAGIIGV